MQRKILNTTHTRAFTPCCLKLPKLTLMSSISLSTDISVTLTKSVLSLTESVLCGISHFLMTLSGLNTLKSHLKNLIILTLIKEIADSLSLKPVLSDFFKSHPTFSYKTFIGDASFDSYDSYKVLHDDFKFKRICIPINLRNSSSAHTDFDSNGTPVCPIDKTPFNFHSISGGKNRSKRFKWVCHKSLRKGNSRVCVCETPCSPSKYGKCVYTYPHKNLRLYPGIPRATEHWNNLYKHRTLVERTINIIKDDFGVAHRRAFSHITAKADLFLAGITQLLGVILAFSIKRKDLFKSVRKLISP